MEAVACPTCAYPNDETFHFCQQCGYKRKGLPVCKSSLLSIDVSLLDARASELETSLAESAYEKQKTALEQSLVTFLLSLSTPKDLLSATPLDVKRFYFVQQHFRIIKGIALWPEYKI